MQMFDLMTTPESANKPAPLLRPAIILTVLGLLIVVAIGVSLVLRFVDQERQRDLRNWQIRLGIVADSRKAAIDGWLAQQWAALDGIAQNNSVQLFMTELKAASGNVNAVTDGQGQAGYLETLLSFTADQRHFTAPLFGPDVPADVGRIGVAGIAIFDNDGHMIVATRGTPSGEAWISAFLAGSAKGQTALRDIFADAAGHPAMAFLDPVFAVQSDATPDRQVGWVLGVKEIGAELYPLLHQPGAAEGSAEALLVRRNGATVDYLSPLRDHAPLSFRLAADTPDLAEADALGAIGGFSVKRDYRDVQVLYVSRAIVGAPWVLLYKIDRSEALGAADGRARLLLVFFLLSILLIVVAFIAVWRHGASRRFSVMASQYRALAQRFERQSNLTRLVTDSQPNAIFITNEDGSYRFANRQSAAQAGISAADILGKSLAAVLGPVTAGRYQELNKRALASGQAIRELSRTGDGPSLRVVQSQHIPLEPAADIAHGVLVIEENLTEVTAEQERRRHTLEQLVKCLMSIADRRDPTAARHSSSVAMVARAVASDMGHSPALVDTAELAGNLMNLGKILVPASILTRAGPLRADELDLLHDSLLEATRFLEGIEFDGPVMETLRQIQERWDGKGRPQGLAGQDILPSARVLAVANAFVAMVSPRAYRRGLSMDAALRAVLDEMGTRFDPAAVAALANHVENKGGRAAWAYLSEPAPSAPPRVIDPI
jgi:HD-GYP domain-containing protein (c-di-GMP phosphodiesterase class II)